MQASCAICIDSISSSDALGSSHAPSIFKIVLIYLDTMKHLVMLVALTSDMRLRIMAGSWQRKFVSWLAKCCI